MNPARAFSPSAYASPVAAAPAASVSRARYFDPSGRGGLHWTSTGRSALRPILLYLRKTGRLAGKNAEVLAPRWACLSLYQTLRKACFPTIQDSPNLAGVLAYHQYGFPQRLDRIAQRCRDRGLFLIEDCVNNVFDGAGVHAIAETGIAGIFSLSKMFRTVLGGALLTRDAGLEEFCADYFSRDERWISSLSHGARLLSERRPGRFSQRFEELTYALSDYGRRPSASSLVRLDRELAGGAVALRRARYARLRREFAGLPFFEGLEADVIPYVAPLFGPKPFLEALARRLSSEGWESGVYHFDRARDVFEPDFVPCVPLPVHQGMTDADADELIESIRTEWRRFDGQR